MPEIIIDATQIADGEAYFAMCVDRSKGAASSIVADLKMGLTGPVSAEIMQPRKLSGLSYPRSNWRRRPRLELMNRVCDTYC